MLLSGLCLAISKVSVSVLGNSEISRWRQCLRIHGNEQGKTVSRDTRDWAGEDSVSGNLGISWGRHPSCSSTKGSFMISGLWFSQVWHDSVPSRVPSRFHTSCTLFLYITVAVGSRYSNWLSVIAQLEWLVTILPHTQVAELQIIQSPVPDFKPGATSV